MTRRRGDKETQCCAAIRNTHYRAASRITHHAIRITSLLLAFATLAFIYSATTPVFEAPDEVWHYNYVRYVATGHGLPSMRNNDHSAYQEAAQPPLYYALAALVTAPIQDSDRREVVWHNPGFGYQSPGTSNDNKNMLVHTAREGWPWRGFTLALHLARLVSLTFGVLTVYATWGLARAVFPQPPNLALTAASVVALTPQFVFMAGVVSNDSAAAALATAALWGIARLSPQATLRHAILTGALIGLAMLTKTSTLLLLPLAWIFGLGYFTPNRQGGQDFEGEIKSHPQTALRLCVRKNILDNICNTQRSAAIRNLIALTSTALLISGWWYARNFFLYGDALGLGVHANTPWGRSQAVSLVALLPELPLVFRSFWAAFGWGGIEAPAWVYWSIGALALISLAGWTKTLVTHKIQPAPLVTCSLRFAPGDLRLIPCLWSLGIFAALLRWMTQVQAPHGRLLFPALGAGAIVLVAGWAAWGRLNKWLALCAIGLLGTFALVSPFVIIQPALLPPPLLTAAQVNARADARNVIYGDAAELAGVRLAQTTAQPGDSVPVTLCWQALRPMTTDYSVFVHILGKNNLVVGARDTWPGLGRFPTSLWPPNRPFCDVVRVQVEAWTPAPAVYGVEVGLYDPQSGTRLETADASLPIVDHIIVRGALPAAPRQTTSYTLGEHIALVGYDAPPQAQAGQPFTITLHWQALAAIQADYTVFVHALDATGQIAAQSDASPRAGDYPTWAWAAGEIIADARTLTVPTGVYTLSVGMYHQPDTMRLPAQGPLGALPNNAIPLTTLQAK